MAVTGINVAKIGEIQNAINEWRKAITSVDIVSTSKQISAAVKGTKREAEIKSLCQSMTSYVNTLTTKLTAYNNRLNEVKSAYVKNDSTSSTALTNAKAAVKSMKS